MGKDVLKVLFIGAVWPEPKSSAGGTRLMQLLHFFQKADFQVHYCSAATETEFMEDLTGEGIQTFSVKLNCDSFNEQVESLQPDVVVFDRFMMEEQYGWRVDEYCPNALKIIETIDLHCLRLARKEQLKSGGNLRDTLLNSTVAKREIAAMFRSDLSLMISEAEIKILIEYFSFPEALIFHLPFEVDLSKMNHEKKFDEKQDFISIGNFKHEPNWDSVLHLKKVIFPLIREQLPKAKMKVYGSYPDEKAFNLTNESEGFHVLGRAEDAQEVMIEAKVCIAPLRFGAGIKGKLIDAMLSGTPNVTTTIGAEGMSGGLEWSGVIADNDQDFADAAVKLYTDKNTWYQAVQRGELILKQCFSVQEAQFTLKAKIQMLLENIQIHRQNNFTGSMLKHHTLLSTKFMSRWIQEKNK
ncbi:MAG: glycosyltransferase involved in cell wall biosynthesis [Saprospiraceae bacterium]|jgi:glycosyltransferase involved in cell wall biosynthesis